MRLALLLCPAPHLQLGASMPAPMRCSHCLVRGQEIITCHLSGCGFPTHHGGTSAGLCCRACSSLAPPPNPKKDALIPPHTHTQKSERHFLIKACCACKRRAQRLPLSHLYCHPKLFTVILNCRLSRGERASLSPEQPRGATEREAAGVKWCLLTRSERKRAAG